MTSATKSDHAARQKASGRLVPLDGMRGLAAVIVFAHHALALLYAPLAGINRGGQPLTPHLAAVALHTLPLGWLFNGAFAVSFFFVLSGFVLTLAAGAHPGPERMARLMSARLLRLLPLVVLGTLFGFAAFKAGVHGLDMLQPFYGDTSQAYIAKPLLEHHGLGDALRQMAVRIWGGADPAALFDPPLWSIGVELQGSLLVYMLAIVFADAKRSSARYWVGVPVGLCLMGTAAICFLMGMWLADRLQRHGDGVVVPVSGRLLACVLPLVLVWASVHPWDPTLWLPLPFAPRELARTVLDAAAAAALLVCGLQLAGLRRFLSTAPVRFLGEASYGLYVVHAPLLYVAAAPLMHVLITRLGYNGAAGVTAVLLLGVSVAVGFVLVKYVDTPMARRSKRWVTDWLAA